MNTLSTSSQVEIAPTERRTALIAGAALFAIWGMALGLYFSFFYSFAKFFGFAGPQLGFAFALFHIAYFVQAVPAAAFHRQFGYKLGIVSALSAFGVSAFLVYFAVVQHSSICFLAASAVMGSSGAWLDTSLNPMMIEAGNPRTSVIRLNVAQCFSALGLLAGYFTAIMVIDSHFQFVTTGTSHFSPRPYVLIGLGAILLAFLVENLSFPSFIVRRSSKKSDLREEVAALLQDKAFLIAAASMGACCAVLTLLWSANYRFHMSVLPGHAVPLFQRGVFWWVVGRCAGTLLMHRIDPIRLLQGSACLCGLAILYTAVAGGIGGWVTLLSASAFLSILYPTVLGSALCKNRTRMKAAAGLLTAAGGMGSALFTVLAYLALEVAHIDARLVIGFALPILAVVLAYAAVARRNEAHSAS